MRIFSRAFTLIELLVVISIIGLLASIVMSSISIARDRARLAAGIEFSASLYHALGDEAVGYWSFDSVSSGNVSDVSGNGFYLTGIANDKIVSTPTPFSGSGKSVSSSADPLYRTPNGKSMIANSFTMSAWVYLNKQNQNNQSIISIADESGRMIGQLLMDSNTGNQVTFFSDPNVLYVGQTLLTPALSINKWYNVAVSYDQSSSKITLYMDGRSVSSAEVTVIGNSFDSINSVKVGGIVGNIDDAAVYAKSMLGN